MNDLKFSIKKIKATGWLLSINRVFSAQFILTHWVEPQ